MKNLGGAEVAGASLSIISRMSKFLNRRRGPASPPSASRYAVVSRRSVIKGTVAASTMLVFPGLACGTGDEDVFAGAAAQDAGAGTSAATAAAAQLVPTAQPGATTNAEPTTLPAVDVGAPTADAATAATALPSGTAMVINYTYSQQSGGKNLPPYVAVWIEDANGELFHTVALWFQQDDKGRRWLPDLKRWFTVDQSRINDGGSDEVDVISSATRLPGAYSMVWNGSLLSGSAAPAGDYFICIESARERGPYSLIREPITLAGAPIQATLPDTGELVSASVAVA